MTEIEFVGYSAVHPSDFIYDVPNGFTGYEPFGGGSFFSEN